MRRDAQREFRPSWVVRSAVLGALAVWCAIGVLALALDGVAESALAGIAFFVAFFVVCTAHYFSHAFVVSEYGVTVRGATDFDHYEWDEIVTVRGGATPLGGYVVTTTRGVLVVDASVEAHDDLAELIVTRAGLMPI